MEMYIALVNRFRKFDTIEKMNKRILYSLILILISSSLFGQIDLKFQSKVSDFKESVNSDVSIIFPNRLRVQIYQDTVREYDVIKKGFSIQTGEYKVVCRFVINNKVDSVDYVFSLKGNESDIEISIDLGQDIQAKWINNIWTEINRKNNGHISVVKYYKSPKSISLYLADIEFDEYYKGPFFRLNNNSKDTIYGEYLPGYFWGSLSIVTNDSTRSRKLIGIIDTQFEGLPPLSPDSNRIASVGSFGLFKHLPKSNYRYELLYSTTGNFHEYREYINKINIEWWAKTEEFYRLIYDFEVK